MRVSVSTSVGVLTMLVFVFLALRMVGGRGAQSRSPGMPETPPGRSASGCVYSQSRYDITRLPQSRVDELATDLTPEERRILLAQGTSQPFQGTMCNNKAPGSYTCRLCGLPLYSSDTKFTSGTGWPSFFQPADPTHIYIERDTRLGVIRTEVQCARCRSHLGHVFEDGPEPTGLRYCLNSAALRFFEENAELPPESRPVPSETAYFAGGCFWGIEDRFGQVSGVMDAVSGYMGGATTDPTYEEVCSGETGHAETVRVVYDPKRVSFRQLLESFFEWHDPTQLNRQGPDLGSQYRSAIFTVDDEQLRQAREYTDALQQADTKHGRTIVTRLEPAGRFYQAEDYHQDYHARHGGSCRLPTD